MNLLTIIVVYNIKITESKSFNSIFPLISSDDRILIYDNSAVKQNIPQEYETYSNIDYIWDNTNGGVAKAYNEGIKFAKKHNFKWVILLDQDTLILDNLYITKIKKSISLNSDIPLFVPMVFNNNGIMSPRKCKNFKIGEGIFKIGINKLENVSIINSGMIVNVHSFVEVGGYNEKVYLDFSDYQFIERLSHKYSNFYLFDSRLQQDFSNDETNKTKLLNRFRLYCDCLRNFETQSINRKLYIYYSGLRHCLGLIKRTKDINFLFVFIKNLF